MFSSYVTAPGPGTASKVATPVLLPALPPATAIAAPMTARHATTRRPRVRFIFFSLPFGTAETRTQRAKVVSCQMHDSSRKLAARRGSGPRATMRPPGDVAEWLGRGLQSLVQRFESARRLRWLACRRLGRSERILFAGVFHCLYRAGNV